MTLIKTSTLWIAALLALASAPAPAQDRPQPRLPLIEISAGMYRIQAEVAISEAQQQTGMMFRRTMGENEGMLFANDEPGLRCFWMHNTLIPLTAAFVDDDGTIVNLADMAPQTDTSHCSIKPVRFVLEMRQGWFAKRGLKAGLKLRGRPFGN
ncbi:MAG: DUF192 domain-containing protein [Burkholderiales bacterium]|nr:DUF192 domain-containing protein [Burkholderiales bacterium]